jgi:prenyl protein peptidase
MLLRFAALPSLVLVLFTGVVVDVTLVHLRWGGDPLWARLREYTLWEGLRDLVVGPVTEEIVFRRVALAWTFAAYQGEALSSQEAAVTTALVFGFAHAHHAFRVLRDRGSWSQVLPAVAFQTVYTAVFGWAVALGYLRTGSLAGAIVAHTLCNFFGFPSVSQQVWYSTYTWPKLVVGVSYVAGLTAFCWLARQV